MLGQTYTLQPTVPLHSDWFSFETVDLSQGPDLGAYEIFRSSDLHTWERIATAHHLPVQFADPASTASSQSYYQMRTRKKTESDDWRNIVALPGRYPGSRPIGYPDIFVYPDLTKVGWGKFVIDLTQPPGRVIYQNSRNTPFHYDFATRHFDRYKGVSHAEFDAVTLIPGPMQELALGAVIVGSTGEIGVQFAGQAPFPVEQIAEWIALVGTTLNRATPVQLFYVPTYEQSRLSEKDIAYLADQNISVANADRWRPGNSVYAPGWAVGTLKNFAADEIAGAFADGRLQSSDILMIDSTPAELPPVAGIISLSPATDNSHVAILARSTGIPFVYLRDENDRVLAASHAGKDIYFSASTGFFFNSSSNTRIDLVPFDNSEPTVRAELLKLKEVPELIYPAKQSLGTISRSVDGLTPDAISLVGGKAANYGFLRSIAPDSTPEAIAFGFDLWDRFMGNAAAEVDGSPALREFIASNLNDITWPVADMTKLSQCLETIRTTIKATDFTASQQTDILQALGPFDPRTKVRFRSSTNVEDGATFSGAGLYDSFSGCIADDTDADETGPSACDPDRDDEQGVFRAIKKVYASFYNLNAYLERLRHGVSETDVGMAILTHYSYPDESELANGVATVAVAFGEYREVRIVTQKGALSVSNPDGNVEPEIVSGFSNTPVLDAVQIEQTSPLVVLGGSVMDWMNDYLDLGTAMLKVYDAYAKRNDAPSPLILDFEFKRIAPDKLVIKQVRPIPPARSDVGAPFLLNSESYFAVEEGEQHNGFFGRHRVKSRWKFKIRSLRLTNDAQDQSFLSSVTHEWNNGTEIKSTTTPVNQLVDYQYRQEESHLYHSWKETIGGETTVVTLTISDLPTEKDLTLAPVVTLDHLSLGITLNYSTSKPELVYDFELGQILGITKSDSGRLSLDTSSSPASPLASLQTRELTSQNAEVKINTEFYWPPAPTGPTAGYTAPAQKWVSTTISGILEEPFTIHGYYAQTYIPGHHNFTENFIFEPARDLNLSPQILEALAAKNVHYILGRNGDANVPALEFFGFDGSLRESL
ncbi:MAG: PEP/pyruvate-binding domain-containing protein [Verrucomicrobiales bacterium]